MELLEKEWHGYRSPITLSGFFSQNVDFINSKARFVIDVLNLGKNKLMKEQDKGQDLVRKEQNGTPVFMKSST